MERLMNTVADFVRRSPVVEIERISQFKETYGIFLPRADLKPQYIEFVNQIRKISRGGANCCLFAQRKLRPGKENLTFRF
ncbi:MAG: hypothetical protein J6O04_09535 [Selenomonadaceae bacterium]|nr:hypothetical protein [Selenomonadaceae bacterium]